MAQPDLIPMPFAENATPGTIEPIPATTPTVPQDATWSTGFPQVTMQPLASGGIPPRGQNFNGVLNALSQHIFHMQGGGQYKWDDAHGPYSIGDVLQSDDGLSAYVSATDNNIDNFNESPGVIGLSWLPWGGDAKASSSLSVLAGAGLTGGGTLTQNRTLAVQFGTTAGTVMEGNDSRIAGAVPQTRQIIAGTGLTGGGDLSADRTLSVDFATTSQAQALTADDVALTPAKLAAVIKEGVTVSGPAVFTSTTNNIQKTGIVTALSLEVGDVIQVSGTASNNKIFTVESITDDNNIVVNYEHRNGAGSLSLTNETVSCAIKLLCKWFRAPVGLGQAWVDVVSSRAPNTNYTSPTNRSIACSLLFNNNISSNAALVISGVVVGGSPGQGTVAQSAGYYAEVTKNSSYSLQPVSSLARWAELR